MKNAEKFRKIFKEFATEVWAFPEKDFLTWLNAEYEEPTTKNNLGVEEVTALAEWTARLTKASEDAYNKGYADGMKAHEPRKGHWKIVPYEDTYYCSECNLRLDDEQTYIPLNYCPKCGAKMEVEK